jgi:hypothetical protein
LITIAELPEFSRRSSKLLTEDERHNLYTYLASHPTVGILIAGTGGIRKVRWLRGHQGKNSGIRVIYYFYNEHIPLYLLTLFAKSDRENLTKSDRNDLADLVTILKKSWKGAQH